MKKMLLPFVLLAGLSVQAQQTSIFGIGALDMPFQWKAIQSFSMGASSSLQTLYDSRQEVSVIDAQSRKKSTGMADAGLIAAAGYHASSRQLFYIPMFTPELRWARWDADGSPVIYSLPSRLLSELDLNKTEQQITRMTVDAKGKGYALTNDAMHLIEFTTGDRPVLRDLGQLIDAAGNGQHSVHNACASFGGDMVAADDGNIYLISQRSQIYIFNPQNRIAHHAGSIKGLPQTFTPNGAAATADGELLLTCSNGNQNCYIVDPHSWEARPAFSENPNGFNMSDLASGYLLSRKPKSSTAITGITQNIQLFPNPLSTSRLQITIDHAVSGNYQVQLIDLTGKIVNQQVVNLRAGSQSFYINYPAETAKGTYFIKMTQPEDKTIHTSKLIIQ
jgi:hypothetical protein